MTRDRRKNRIPVRLAAFILACLMMIPAFSLGGTMAAETYPVTIKFMEYNVLALGGETGDPDDTVSSSALLIRNRASKVLQIVTDYGPDIAVFTEFNAAWWNAFQTFAAQNSSKYGFIGHSDFDHEYNTSSGVWDSARLIMYDKTKFELLNSGWLWGCSNPKSRGYSYDTPDTSSGKVYLHASQTFNWARFMDKQTRAVFAVYGIHPFSNAQALLNVNLSNGFANSDSGRKSVGNVVRKATARMLTEWIPKTTPDMPVIIAGDFNDNESAAGFQIYTSAGYRDSRSMDSSAVAYGTCPGVNKISDSSLRKKDAIDHILLSNGHFTVTNYEVKRTTLNSSYFPSDHLPVTATLHMKVAATPSSAFELKAGSGMTVSGGYVYLNEFQTETDAFLAKFKGPLDYTHTAKRYVGTGCVLTYIFDTTKKATVVIPGDTSGDGRLSSADYLAIVRHFNGAADLGIANAKAADLNGDGMVTTFDYFKVKRMLSGG